jgi:hypothetical protein
LLGLHAKVILICEEIVLLAECSGRSHLSVVEVADYWGEQLLICLLNEHLLVHLSLRSFVLLLLKLLLG